MTLGRLRLSVMDARDLAEGALRGIGYHNDEARIIAEHYIVNRITAGGANGNNVIVKETRIRSVRSGRGRGKKTIGKFLGLSGVDKAFDRSAYQPPAFSLNCVGRGASTDWYQRLVPFRSS